MWPFSNRRKSARAVPAVLGADHQWAGRIVRVDGLPLVIRYNRSAWNWAGHPKLPIKLSFAIPLDQSSASVPPTATPQGDAGLIEDVILREVNSRTKGIHVLTLTNTTMQEFVFYVPPSADFGAIDRSVQRSAGGLEVQCMATEEPSWDTFRALAGE